MALTIYHCYLERETLDSQVGGYESLNMKHERVPLDISPFFHRIVRANYHSISYSHVTANSISTRPKQGMRPLCLFLQKLRERVLPANLPT